MMTTVKCQTIVSTFMDANDALFNSSFHSNKRNADFFSVVLDS